MTISSKLSGTFSSAMGALEMLPGAPISVVDSLCTSLALRLLIEAALDDIAAGATRQQLAAHIEDLRDKVHILFVVDTSNTGQGRPDGNAMPWHADQDQTTADLEDGVIELREQVRSKSAVARMLELAEQRLAATGVGSRVAIAHAVAPDEALAFRKEVVARLGCAEPSISEISAVIGAHTGPGVVAMAAYV